MKTHSRNRISRLIFILSAIAIISNRFLLPRFDAHDVLAILSWDVFGYYLYLPAFFIHHDLGIRDFTWVQQILDTYHPTVGFYQAYAGPAGAYVMKYPMGMAILYSPFYFLAQVIVQFTGYSHDGFTLPYQLCISIGGLFYTLLGLWFMRKVMLRFFSDGVTAFTMVIMVAGTNYFQLTAFDGAMPHNYLFTLFAIILWLTISWHENPGWIPAVLLGALCGLSVLVRPTAIVIVLVPLLWGVWGVSGWREKIMIIKHHFMQVFAMVVVMVLVAGLQLLYWKIYAGSWFYYSYEKGEQLEWIAPYLREVLFSYRKGWLLYTPVMFFAIIGFWPLIAHYRAIFLSIALFFFAHLLIVASWPTWWYGGSFSQRSMMEAYMILAFPMGAFITWLTRQQVLAKIALFGILFMLLFFNIFQTWQYMNFILEPSRMTKAYYWAVFGKTSVRESDRLLLLPSDINDERDYLKDETGFTSRQLALYDFESGDHQAPAISRDTAHGGLYSLKMSKSLEFSPGINLPYQDISKKDFAWLRASAWVYFTCKPEEALCGLVITCNQSGKAYKYRMVELEKQNLKPGTWNQVTMDYMTPFLDDKASNVQAYFWYRGDRQIWVDDFDIRVFEPK